MSAAREGVALVVSIVVAANVAVKVLKSGLLLWSRNEKWVLNCGGFWVLAGAVERVAVGESTVVVVDMVAIGY